MTYRIGINGLGRMGRLVLRAAQHHPELRVIAVNDPAGSAADFAHLLAFDSTQGPWQADIHSREHELVIQQHPIAFSAQRDLNAVDWSGCDLVMDCTGKHKTPEILQGYLNQGVKQVLVSAPIKHPDVLNLVMGVNQHRYNPLQHRLLTAASCTTNCLAPVVKVIHEHLGIRHGSITTLHNITNTQSVLDTPHKDWRRARASGSNLIPTTTGSAMAIGEIFPELKGRLNGHAVRVPLANASLTDCVFEVEQATSAETVNQLLEEASKGALAGILGFERRPLVSSDFCGNPHSAIIDALSTLVVNQTQVKIYAWYDNEWGYVNRMLDLADYIYKAQAK